MKTKALKDLRAPETPSLGTEQLEPLLSSPSSPGYPRPAVLCLVAWEGQIVSV